MFLMYKWLSEDSIKTYYLQSCCSERRSMNLAQLNCINTAIGWRKPGYVKNELDNVIDEFTPKNVILKRL